MPSELISRAVRSAVVPARSPDGVPLGAPRPPRSHAAAQANGEDRKVDEKIGVSAMSAGLLLGCGVVAWGQPGGVDVVFLAAAAVVSLATLALSFRHRRVGGATTQALEERIELLEDLRWQARGDADYLKALLDEQNDVILRRDRDGLVKFANRAFCRTFNVSLITVLEKPFLPVVIERDSTFSSDAGMDEIHSEHRAGEGTQAMPEWAAPVAERIETARGPRWIKWQHKRVDVALGADWEIQTIGRDVTALRVHEHALAAARDQAQAADRAKSRFLASMSHEIRTPMNGILGMTGLIRETRLSPEQRTYADAIHQSATTLLGLIDEILDFSKVEAGRIELKREPVNVAACIQDVVELLAPKAFDKTLELAWSLAPDTPRKVLCDETRLRQILLNLIGNAIKYTDAGGVSVWVGADRAADGNCRLRCVIRDTGPGLGKNECDRIFMEFERATSSDRNAASGTGLGLAIAKRLARSMNGDIEVMSTPGAGATFALTLTLERLGQVASLDVPPGLGGSHVLLVAPAGVERRTIANFMRALDIVVSEVDGAQSEVFRPAGSRPAVDFVLFDGGLDAARACQIVEQLVATGQAAPAIRSAVIALPGEREAIEHFRSRGIQHFLVRPVRPATLLCLLDGSIPESPALLPAATTEPDPHQPHENRLEGPAGRRILLAEDNEINALLSRTLLSRLGCDVVLATDGQQAVEHARAALAPGGEPFDAILMDLNMPALNGFEASARIIELYEAAGACLPAIIAVTANAFEEDRANCLASGMHGYLAKPFEADALAAILEQALRGDRTG